MIPNKLYYQWKVRGESGDLITPWGDAWEHEYPFDLLFESKEQAYEGLDTWGAVGMYWDPEGDEEEPEQGWKPEGWILVKTSVEIVDA